MINDPTSGAGGETDLDDDAPTPPPVAAAPRLRRSSWLIAAGTALLACQQVLGPLLSIQLLSGSTSTSDDAATAFTTAYFTAFGVGLVLLLVGLHRFATHVHTLAVSAQHR